MSTENKILAKKLAKAQQKQQAQQQQQQQQQQQMDRIYTSHDVSGKDSQNDVLLMKKPFLKKRSGLFRFYKCLPHSNHHHHHHHSTVHHHHQQQQNHHHQGGGPSLPTRHRESTNNNNICGGFSMKNSRGTLINSNNNHGGAIINMGIGHSHRSTTYNPHIGIGEVKQVLQQRHQSSSHSQQQLRQQQQQQQQQKRERESSADVEIFEILDNDDGVEKYSSSNTAPAASSHYNDIDDHSAGFEQGDTHHLLNYHSNHSNVDLCPPHLLKPENENPRTYQPIQTGVENNRETKDDNNTENIIIGNPRNFISKSTTNAGTSRDPEVDYLNNLNVSFNLPDTRDRRCFADEEEEDEQDHHPEEDAADHQRVNLNYPSYVSPSGGIELESDEHEEDEEEAEDGGGNVSESSEEIFSLTNSPAGHQISELHAELMAIKNKIAFLEKNVKNQDGRKTTIIKDANGKKKNKHSHHHHHSSHHPSNSSLSKKKEDVVNGGVSRSAKKQHHHHKQQEDEEDEEEDIMATFKNASTTNSMKKGVINTNDTTITCQNAVEGIQSGLDRIHTEMNDMQSSFLQKIEGLEEEIHIKSQRWCQNQIKMADKVHSLFSELELIKGQVKAQQHQVQNMAENVDKEFETVKTGWRESQEAIQNRVKALEDQNQKLLEKLQHSTVPTTMNTFNSSSSNSNNNSISNDEVEQSRDRMNLNLLKEIRDNTKPSTILTTPVDLDKNRTTTTTTTTINSHQNNNNNPLQVCNQASQVSPTSSTFKNFTEQPMMMTHEDPNSSGGLPRQMIKNNNNSNRTNNISQHQDPKLEIVSTRQTLLNGDIETVYTNGTREIIKADKSEIRHIYRNGDVRTVVTEDGTVTYFYAASSTWQTTYPTGVELFKFPNGVIERRLPNGLIEQTDVEGMVTFFQAAPPKPSNSLLHHPPVASVLKSCETDNNDQNLPPQQQSQSKQPNNHSNNMNMNVGVGGVGPGPIKLAPGERIVLFENGEEEIHGADYRKRIFADGTVKTVYQDGSQETRYPNGRVRIKDRQGVLLVDVPDKNHNHNHTNSSNSKTSKLVRDFGANTNNQC